MAASSDSSAAITVRAENVMVSPTLVTAARTASLGSGAAAQVLPDAEHQEQAVVGPRAEHQNDQQELRDGDLEAGVRRLADQRPGDRHGQNAG